MMHGKREVEACTRTADLTERADERVMDRGYGQTSVSQLTGHDSYLFL